MGLTSGIVAVEDYTPGWREEFERERASLVSALGSLALAVEHVGSTAVPGLCAKPVIDIAVGVEGLDAGHGAIAALTALGYEFKGEAGVPGRYFFAKGGREDRTHYVHVEPLGGELWRNHILFREYLRCHPDETTRYARLKRELANQFGDDRASYAAGKNDYIERVLRAAGHEFVLDAKGRAVPTVM